MIILIGIFLYIKNNNKNINLFSQVENKISVNDFTIYIFSWKKVTENAILLYFIFIPTNPYINNL